jgi:predicted NUDIX family phosphoesterase
MKNGKNMQNDKEQVMVVPQFVFDRFRGNHFVTGLQAVRLYRQMLLRHSFMDRKEADQDQEFRQPIPYILVENENEAFLMATRSKKQGEDRLWGKHALGVGGHVNQVEDVSLCYGLDGVYDPIRLAAIREYTEETGWKDFDLSHMVGLIIRNDGLVERVHVGVMFHHITENFDLISPEKDHHAHRWAAPHELHPQFDGMELWAQTVCSEYIWKKD